ncbi:hypothetical protein IWX90DRAFT_393936, partial [Phyllosticta citrichinensis]
CGATLSRQEHLTRHVRSHTDDRPFACGVCGHSHAACAGGSLRGGTRSSGTKRAIRGAER